MSIKNKFGKKSVGYLVIAVIAISLTVGFLVSTNEADKATGEILTYSTDKPEETKPNKETYKWQGLPTDPKLITMQTIKTEGFVQKVGVDQNKEIAVPNNIYVAGWFNQSVIPGERGLSIVDGHVTGRINNGIFKDLGKLKDGDTFKIEYGNGMSKDFKVVKKVDVPVKDAASVLFSHEPGLERQVNLITCSGAFDKKTQRYANRLIVISEAI